MIYAWLNPHCRFQIFSIAGEGKDQVDRDNGSEQAKLKAAVDAGSDLTHARQFIRQCNARRHKGAINVRVELDRLLAIALEDRKKLKPVKGIADFKLRDLSRADGILCFEFFDLPSSTSAGRPVGYGKGFLISKEILVARHGLNTHRLPCGSATLSFPETDALPDGESAHVNAAGLCSRDEKNAASVAQRQAKAARSTAKSAQDAASAAKFAAMNTSARIVCPRRCGAKFHSAVRLAKHELSGCGRYANAIARRAAHDTRSIKGRLAAHDDDIADEEERIEESGHDGVTVVFLPSTSDYGWTVGAALDADDGAPSSHAGLSWSSPTSPGVVTIGVLVRLSAKYYEDVARSLFGSSWASKFFYGRVLGRTARSTLTFDIIYVDDETHEFSSDSDVLPSHFTHFEIGAEVAVAVVAGREAVVKSCVLGGAASRLLVPVGGVIVNVDGVATPRFDMAVVALETATRRRATVVADLAMSPPRHCTVVVMRRPAPPPPVRGWARPCCFRASAFVWRDDIVQSFDDIVKQPAFERRGQAVFEELKKIYGYALDDEGKCVLPSMKDVENRMINAWKRKEKSKREAAQDSAARVLARASRDAGEANDDDDDDEIIDSDADEEGVANGDVGVSPITRGSAQPTAFDAHFSNLAGIKVTMLRARLRDMEQPDNACAADLPADTPSSGAEKSAAVLYVLRRRLALFLADEER